MECPTAGLLVRARVRIIVFEAETSPFAGGLVGLRALHESLTCSAPLLGPYTARTLQSAGMVFDRERQIETSFERNFANNHFAHELIDNETDAGSIRHAPHPSNGGRPMITRTHSLWTRLQSFEFDTGSPALTFAQRLAQEQRWTQAFALRVLEEYRRFLFLACTLKHQVTPSKHVDEAWHLHLTFTRSYWERLCPQVLQRSLHHDPTRGGAAEGAKFVDWYQRTLEAYREAFDQEPPSDIWPSSKVRFAPHNGAPNGTPEPTSDTPHSPVVPPISPPRSDADYWVIRKPSRGRALTSIVCGLGVMLIGGCTPLVLGTGQSSMPLILILGLFAGTGLLLLLIAAFRKHGGRESTGHTGGGGGCSTYIDSSGGHFGGHHGHGCEHGAPAGSDGAGSDGGGSDGGGGSGDGGGGGGGDGGGGGGCGGGGCGGGGD